MRVSISGFENHNVTGKRITFRELSVNPPFIFEDIPAGTKSLAVIMDNLDQPSGTWTNWVAFDIPVSDRIEENCKRGNQGVNDFGVRYYVGPGTTAIPHRYCFKFYALDRFLNLKNGINKKTLENKMTNHVLAKAEVVGLFKKSEDESSE